MNLYPPISTAISEGDVEAMMQIMEAHPEAFGMITVFGPWLHYAARNGQLIIVQKLIQLGADVNIKSGVGGTALNKAASRGHYGVVKYLLDSGSEMDVSTSEDNPLFGAIYGGHMNIAKLLIERGIDWKIAYQGTYVKNRTALAFAKERGRSEFVEYLSKL